MKGLDPSDPAFEKAVKRAVRGLAPWASVRVAEDVAQEIRIVLWQKGGDFPHQVARRAFLDQIYVLFGRTRDTDTTRRGFLRRELLEMKPGQHWQHLVADYKEPDPVAVRSVAAALEKLSPKDQKVLRMRYWEDMTGRDIGKEIGRSESTTCRMLELAEQRFRKAFKELCQ